MAYSDKTGTAVPKFIVHGGFLGGFQLDASNVFSGLPTGSAALADGASAVTGTLNSTAFNGSQKTVISALNQLAYDDTQLQTGITSANSQLSAIGASDVAFTAGAGMAAMNGIDMNKGSGNTVVIAVDGVLEDLDTLGPDSGGASAVVMSNGSGGFGYVAILDEDNLGSDSAFSPATQQSIKAYVDSQVGANNSISEMSDTTIAAAADGDFLMHNGTAWVDRTTAQVLSQLSVESGATGDQSNAEIRTAVEAATDSNVFTDADHSKLNAIEASADVTDTANVTSAGALMDSEITNLADVKAFAFGSTVQAYDAGLGYLAGLSITDEGTMQEQIGLEIGVDVQAYDADTQKLDVVQTVTAAKTFNHEKLIMKDSAGTSYTLSIVGGILKIVS
tara:strand:+ start:423 stop:1595 length:1173 start_codon:yes stop_codon:yes gene_type:complete